MKVSVIVPVYKGISVTLACARSLDRFGPRDAEFIFIGDRSDEHDEMSRELREFMRGRPQFRYFENETNLGFVGTCNRGVNELSDSDSDILLLNSDAEVTEGSIEELMAVAHSSEKHGLVNPRSNNATLVSLPLDPIDKNLSREDCYLAFQKFRLIAPRWHTIPTCNGFCIYIKRSVIRLVGLFDPSYGKGYNEENDLCMRAAKFGISCVVANRSFVFHEGTVSFGKEDRKALDAANYKVLTERFPHYPIAISNYYGLGLPWHEYYSEHLSRDALRKTLLILLPSIGPYHNGTSEYGMSLMKYLLPLVANEFEVTVAMQPESVAFHSPSWKSDVSLLSLDEFLIGAGKYSAIFCPMQYFSADFLVASFRQSLRIAFVLQDIIALRCTHLNCVNHEAAQSIQAALSLVDRVIGISEFCLQDAIAYFSGKVEFTKKSSVIEHGIDVDSTVRNRGGSDTQRLLVVGNHFTHKAIRQILDTLVLPNGWTGEVLGGDCDLSIPGMHIYASGSLTNGEVEALYSSAKILVFPSTYEGFGLPVIRAVSMGIKLVLYDNELNRSLVKRYGWSRNTVFYKRFVEVSGLVQELANRKQPLPKDVRSWSEVAVDTNNLINEMIKREPDGQLLRERHRIVLESTLLRTKKAEAEKCFVQVFWPENNGAFTEGQSERRELTLGTSNLLDFGDIKKGERVRLDPINLGLKVLVSTRGSKVKLVKSVNCRVLGPLVLNNSGDPMLVFEARRDTRLRIRCLPIIELGKRGFLLSLLLFYLGTSKRFGVVGLPA